MPIDDDLSVFFDTDEFASECILSRSGVLGEPFAGNFGMVDEETLGAHAMGTRRSLRYATDDADLVADDILFVGGVPYRVDRSDLVNDGRESLAILFKVSV
jgi:hypothetical protein